MPVTTADITLTPEELRRYNRHLILPEVGLEGQKKLKAASVLLVGAGGLGSPLALYLAAAGVGRLGLVDFDVVDETNLQRQVLHGTKDVGRPKLESARDRILDINPHVQVDLYETRLTSENALDIIKEYDLVADGTDNFPTRYLVNDACVLAGKPNVYASIFRFEGQVSVFGTPDGPCYRCLYPEPPPPGLVPSCAEGGVLGVLPGLVGTIQATEVIKMILGIGTPLIGRLLLVDALHMQFRTLKVRKNPECPICGEHRTIHELIDYEQFCGLPSRNGEAAAQQTAESEVPEITVHELKARLERGDRPVILDVRKPHEVQIASIEHDLLIPVDELPERLSELEPYRDREIVVYCRSGARSARATKLLREAGFRDVKNLKGGILAWSQEIDPSIPQY
ncbi:molybdopterin-synthase adenylyltransferase MoeB [Rhodothermus marinus]|uniref:molybdopterin-synthase adenylyltransferase MoeB n=1 Tax=Rhodothermus marinus TaxID=29549 RepID=UPI0012BA3D8D|nr:molybdopterin-synthase adenylyltransferase MoeB [Rhodothermus marinus]BBM72985.1 molybdenum cofactor biosynthesis protein MoeB [Rhodothermus marinus]